MAGIFVLLNNESKATVVVTDIDSDIAVNLDGVLCKGGKWEAGGLGEGVSAEAKSLYLYVFTYF